MAQGFGLPGDFHKTIAGKGGSKVEKYKKLVVPLISIASILFVIVTLATIIYAKIETKKLNKLEIRWKNIEKEYEVVLSLKKEQKRFQDLIDDINEISESRILWSARLNDISDCLPREIQLTEISTRVEKNKDKSEKFVLIISGLVPASPGESAISEFLKCLRENPGFFKEFPEMDPPTTQTNPKGFKDFTIRCYIGKNYGDSSAK